jgi:catechol 2,3-dioxygenase-like lactoylglutathione lyase family enzyme
LKLRHIDHVAIAVRDLERSIAWYRDVLGLERRFEDAWDEPAILSAGETSVALFRAEGDSPKPPPGGDTIAMRHFAFVTDAAGLAAAGDELRARGIAVREADHGIARSIYLRDPDGHQIEITTYEV